MEEMGRKIAKLECNSMGFTCGRKSNMMLGSTSILALIGESKFGKRCRKTTQNQVQEIYGRILEYIEL